MKKIYAALIISVALVKVLEFVIGFTAAIAIPRNYYELFGPELGSLVVNIFTITVPYFLISLALLPLLGILSKSKTVYYSAYTMLGVILIMVWESLGSNVLNSGYIFLVPLVLGFLSVVVAGWLVGKRYTAA
ncbi:hypothetical protein Q4561_18100 [Alteromonas sp. 1_MG-2023]|uniref:hypothetical protein n=1 Tax=Alteromonas sp. 1_MG-2023 TaxID=3062669 RepID=UPI0026E172E3|nr:hypothetical protein [Alteromonas sp. 1_MG-2023]MDO6568990.1 hypothetical protein [Alteromonas sp. 1_MG-2023]